MVSSKACALVRPTMFLRCSLVSTANVPSMRVSWPPTLGIFSINTTLMPFSLAYAAVRPETPDELKAFFKSHGDLLVVRRGEVVCGKVVNSAPYGLDDLIYIESGFLAQAYFTSNPNKPKAISVALKCRVLNYASFLGFDNRGENLIAKKKSALYAIKRHVLEALLAQEPRFLQLLQTYCIACVASDYDAFTCMFTCDVEERILYFFNL